MCLSAPVTVSYGMISTIHGDLFFNGDVGHHKDRRFKFKSEYICVIRCVWSVATDSNGHTVNMNSHLNRELKEALVG